MKRRETGQRNIVYEAAKSLYHPTAEEVCHKLREDGSTVGRATVFRNLSVLSEEGKFVRLFFADQPTRYDTNPAPHDHFVCLRCGKIIDIEATSQPRTPKGLCVESATVTFYGTCEECLKKESN